MHVFTIASAMLSLLACGVACGGTADRSDEGAAEGALIGGGVPAMAQRQELKPVVYLGRCTATKVGPRHFLTAAHCILAESALTPFPGKEISIEMSNYEDGPYVDRVERQRWPFLEHISLDEPWQEACKIWSVSDDQQNRCRTVGFTRNAQAYTGGASDVALVVMKDLAPPTQSGEVNHSVRDLPEIPVTTKALVAGEAVTLAGYGCSGDAAAPPSWLRNNILRIGATKVVDGNASVGAVSDDWKQLGARYLFTENVSSLCAGDSGGPVLVKRGAAGHQAWAVAGVHAGFTTQGNYNVLANWHTRLDDGAKIRPKNANPAQGAPETSMGDWLRAEGATVLP